ncbi:MAG: hypothetical protein ACLFV3_07880 [Phycisphaeraceae bacterium]
MPRLIALFLVTALLAAPAMAQEAEPAAADLPVTRAVLFSSGVGYFEHAGTVEGDQTLRLVFQKDQINDVLKSLVVIDAGGGQVTRVAYPTQDPIERTLSSFAVDLSSDRGLPKLLGSLRGAQVTLSAPEPISGRVVSVQERTQVVGEPAAKVTEHVLTLATGDGLKTVPMSSVQAVKLEDPQLQEELSKALRLLAESRDTQRRPVEIRFEGEGTREVRVGYLVESPVWKTSYRLDMTGVAAAEQGEATLQGWAIVENMSEADWRDVTLSLVSGQPISFRTDLYTPLYVPRPEMEVPRYAALQPRVFRGGLAEPEEAAQLGQMLQRDRSAGAAMEPMRKAEAAGDEAAPWGLEATVEARTATADIGELFRFTLETPVSLARRRSAMLPIVTGPIEAERVSIYRGGQDAMHPMRGARLTNTTGVRLLAGPVTVLDEGMYAGDAMLDNLPEGDDRLIGFATDLSVKVDERDEPSRELVGARIVDGVLRLTRKFTYRRTYVIDNGDSEPRAMIIEHRRHPRRELVQPEEAWETAPGWHRFRVPVEAGRTGEFAVVEEQPLVETIALLDKPIESWMVYATSGRIDADVREALEKAAKLKRELSRLEAALARQKAEIESIGRDQARIRENLERVGSGSQLGQRYLEKLSQQETRIEEIRAKIDELEDSIGAKKRELADYLKDLDVE